MHRPVHFEYPLTEKLAKYDDQALIALIHHAIGVRPIAIVKHFKHNRLHVFFDRELTRKEREKLMEVLANPPTLYIAEVRSETEDEIKKRIAKKTGVEPTRIVVAGENIVQLIFNKPIDTSKLTEEDLKVRKRIIVKPSTET